MRKSACILFALALTLQISCKDKQSINSTKDFAFSATAKNFSVTAGYAANNELVVADISNWENLLKREQLGKFTPVYIEKTNATVANLKDAFKLIGSQMTEDSTVVFAYSGPGKAGNLTADKEFTYDDLAASLQEGLATNKNVKKAKRFYMFIESDVSDSTPETTKTQLEKVFLDFNAAEKKQSFFEEALIFSSIYSEDKKTAATVTSSNTGRFSYEFVKALDTSIQKIRSGATRPTLRVFFDSIVLETGRIPGRESTYRLKPDALQKETLFPASFVPPLEPAAPGATPLPGTAASPSPVPSIAPPAIAPVATTPIQPIQQPAATGSVAEVLSLSLQSESGPTNLKDQFKGNVMLLEISASWCGPCQSLARTIAEKTQSNASINSGKCSSAALIVTDNNSSLANWRNATSPQIAAHSFQTGSGSELSQWLSRLSGPAVQIKFFPTLFLVNSAGQVQAVGSEQALSAFASSCP